MKEIVVTTPEEFDKAIEDMEKKGMNLACMSNTGLPEGEARLTFLPEKVCPVDNVTVKMEKKDVE